MKLVEILARELKEWPSCTDVVGQAIDGTIHLCASFDANMHGHSDKVFSIAEDSDYAEVTRAQWEAERARIYRETPFPNLDADADAEAIVDDRCESTKQARSKEDQALWDKVAIALAPAVYAECCKEMDATGYPENWREGVANDWVFTVDAFMAERARRMKG